MPSAPASLDPAQALQTGDFTFEVQAFDTLVEFDGQSAKLVGALATDWSSSADARSWRLKLRSGVRFHDGTVFDAAAVKANFEYFASSVGLLSFVFPRFKSIKIVSPTEIEVVTVEPAPDFVRSLSIAGIISPKVIAKGPRAPAREPIGTGPFIYVSRSATEVKLRQNPDYWRDGPYFEELVLQVMPDEASRISALRTGQVDVVASLSPTLRGQLANVDGVKLVDNPTTWRTVNIGLRSDVAPTNDLRVRQAMAYALDIPAVGSSIYRSQFIPDASYMPPGVIGYQPARPAVTQDLERARELVRQAGGGKPITIDVAMPSGSSSQLQALQAFADQWREVGFEVNVNQLEEGVFNSETVAPTPRNQAFSTSHGWANGGPVIFEVGLVDADSAFDRGMPRELVARKNELMTAVKQTPDGPQRDRAIGELQNVYAEQMAIIPLFYAAQTDVVRSNLNGYYVPRNCLGTSLGGVFRVQ